MCKLLFKRDNHRFSVGCGIINIEDIDADNTSILHYNENLVFNSYQHVARQKSFKAGRYASKKAIEVLFPGICHSTVEITKGVFDFPIVKSPLINNLQVSLSHSNNICVALAFPEEHPIGIDVDEVQIDSYDIILQHLTEREADILKQDVNRRNELTMVMWTMKEALSKVLRTGLMIDLKILELDQFSETEDFFFAYYINFHQYKVYAKKFRHIIFSVAMPRNSIVNLTPLWNSFSRFV